MDASIEAKFKIYLKENEISEILMKGTHRLETDKALIEFLDT